VKTLGGPDVPAIGFALGVDRLVKVHPLHVQSNIAETLKKVFVALAGSGTDVPGFRLLRNLRKAGCTAEIGASEKSLKSQLRQADGWGATHVVIMGEDELKRGCVQWKDLKDHAQKEIPLSDVIGTIERMGKP
jgi:histidyl-tRNA synthetase